MENFSQARIKELEAQVEALGAANLKLSYVLTESQGELQQRRKAIELLTQLSQEAAGQSDPLQLSQIFVSSLQLGLAMDCVSYWRWNAESKSLVHQTSAGEKLKEGEEPSVLIQSKQMFENLKSPQILNSETIKNYEQEPGFKWILKLKEKLNCQYLVTVPLLDHQSFLGVLIAGRNREARPFSPRLNDVDASSLAASASAMASWFKSIQALFLEEVDRVKNEFFANISHELRTPITLSLLPIESMLAGDCGPLTAVGADRLEMVRRSQRSLLRLVNEILDLAKLEAGRENLEGTFVRSVGKWLRQRVAFFEQPALEKGLKFLVEVAEELDAISVQLDESKFERILNNLLSNAIKYTPAGYVRFFAKREEDGKLFISVSDTGAGFSPEELPNLFTRFTRFKSAEKTKATGTGLGLSLIKRLVDLFQGKISIKTAEGEGTSFRLVIPLLLSTDDSTTSREDQTAKRNEVEDFIETDLRIQVYNVPSVQHGEEEQQRAKVLYVDDNSDLSVMVGSILEKDFDVIFAADGEAAWECVQKELPDLVISDYMMPKMNGIELLRRIRAEPNLQEIPFVLVTANPDETNRMAALQARADDFLFKPFHAPEVLARSRNLIRLRKSQNSLRKEMSAARDLQLQLLPKIPAQYAPFHLDGIYLPCEVLSGDSYDFIQHGEYLYVYLADVMSHGTPAAQVTFLLKNLIREEIFKEKNRDYAKILSGIQQSYKNYKITYDVALQIFRLNLSTRQLQYAQSGCVPPVQFLAKDSFERTKVPAGPAIAMHGGDGDFPLLEMTLQPGQAFLMMTDGCLNQGSTQRRAWMKLEKILTEAQSPENWSQALYPRLLRTMDDQTMVWVYG